MYIHTNVYTRVLARARKRVRVVVLRWVDLGLVFGNPADVCMHACVPVCTCAQTYVAIYIYRYPYASLTFYINISIYNYDAYILDDA